MSGNGVYQLIEYALQRYPFDEALEVIQEQTGLESGVVYHLVKQTIVACSISD